MEPFRRYGPGLFRQRHRCRPRALRPRLIDRSRMRNMRISTTLALGAALLASPVLAQNTPAKNNAAIKDVHTVNDGSARRGANSFTQAQARQHIAKSGFTNVSALAKDKNGVWRGT